MVFLNQYNKEMSLVIISSIIAEQTLSSSSLASPKRRDRDDAKNDIKYEHNYVNRRNKARILSSTT